MDIDIYQPCPCHSGKKIKFCCAKDIVHDLDQILNLTRGKQHVAALEKVDRLLDKSGPRACLSVLKTHLLINLKEYAQANEVNAAFLREHPDNPTGYAHHALLMAAEGRTDDAVDALQDALEVAPTSGVPLILGNAFRIVGMMLMSHGDVVAGRAHLIFASRMRDGEDEVTGQLVLQTFSSPEVPLLLKSEFPVVLTGHEENQPWADRFLNAALFAERGRWRAARIIASKLDAEYPGQPAIVRAIATWSMNLGDTMSGSAAFRELSELPGVDHDEAVEARAMSLLIDDQPITGSHEFIRTTYALSDTDKFNETAVSSLRIRTGSLFSHHFIDDNAPPPVAGYLLLDKDAVASLAAADEDDFPRVIGEMLVYGRETDRPARLETFVVCDDQFDDIHTRLQDVFGDTLGQRLTDEVVQQVGVLDHAMSFKWHLPEDMTLEQRQEFVQRQRVREYLEIWPNIPFIPLGDRTPAEVANDRDAQLDVEALVLLLEQGADAQAVDSFDFNRLRQHLGLPEPQPITGSEVDLDYLSPIQVQRLDFDNLPDEFLIKAYVMASSAGNLRVLRSAAPVILSRPEMEKFIRFEMVYGMLARLTVDTDEALHLMHKARQHAAAADRPIGDLLVDELELRLERNRPDGCQELLRVLQAGHLREPRTQYRLASVLQRFGIMGPDGSMRDQPPGEPEPVATGAENQIWTPGEPAAESAEPGKSKLWLPD